MNVTAHESSAKFPTAPIAFNVLNLTEFNVNHPVYVRLTDLRRAKESVCGAARAMSPV
jgi:hypothetical protein